jgi:hypothetical protein
MQIRVNIRKLKQTLWLLGVLAFAYSGWTFYDIYSAKKAGTYNPRKKDVFASIVTRDIDEAARAKPKVVGYQSDRYTKLWETLLNGELRKGPDDDVKPVDTTPAAPVVPELSTVIQITTVLFSEEPLGRFVALTYKDEAGGAQGGGQAAPAAPLGGRPAQGALRRGALQTARSRRSRRRRSPSTGARAR